MIRLIIWFAIGPGGVALAVPVSEYVCDSGFLQARKLVEIVDPALAEPVAH